MMFILGRQAGRTVSSYDRVRAGSLFNNRQRGEALQAGSTPRTT